MKRILCIIALLLVFSMGLVFILKNEIIKFKSNNIQLDISSFLPASHTQHTDILIPFIERLEGTKVMNYNLFSGSFLGDSKTQYDLTLNGVTNLSLGMQSYSPGRFPMNDFTELPSMGRNAEESTIRMWELLENNNLFSSEYKEIEILSLFKNDPAQLIMKDIQVKTPSDMNGLVIRSPSKAGSNLLRELGAVPISMPMGEVYESLEKGVIDGALAPASTIYNYQLSDVSKYILKGDFYTSSMFLIINKDYLSKLPREYVKKIKDLSGKKLSIEASKNYDLDADKGWELAKRSNIKVHELDLEEQKLWTHALSSLYNDWFNDNNNISFEIYSEIMEVWSE